MTKGASNCCKLQAFLGVHTREAAPLAPTGSLELLPPGRLVGFEYDRREVRPVTFQMIFMASHRRLCEITWNKAVVVPDMATRGHSFSAHLSFNSSKSKTRFLLPILPASWSWIFNISIGVVTITCNNRSKAVNFSLAEYPFM